MIATTVIDEIRRMLGQGRFSQRKIAQQLGVSRGTVHAVARGKRPDLAPRCPSGNEGFQPPSGLFTHCPGCGGRVQMPCLLCYVRARRQTGTGGEGW